ncbi:glycosyltransferase [Haloarcula sp. 1CSR25-25]|uniref:glycosyltransferase n=1 Tax=Haloarcula sp. 1CSR25-25 TaxID=2862545 RepID=UPI00289523EB|nr:glycosyltransferase [Haloarcula sp. 1CSR25-25]MDT3434237.1 glycosyltransferase [Haloarcula sp. 1CSR25-25]
MSSKRLLLPYLGRWNQFRKSRFHQIAERLVTQGFEIHVLQTPVTESDEVLFRERDVETPDGLILHDADLSDWLWNSRWMNKVLQKGYHGFGTHSQVQDLIEAQNIDALWLYNLPHYRLAVTADVPVIFDYVDDYVAMLNSELQLLDNPAAKRVEHFFFAHILRNADLVFSISNELQQTVQRLAPSTPCEILPNGVDDQIFPVTDGVDRPTLHDPVTVGFVGSFEYFIDFDMILQAANRLPEYRFLLVGDGREFDRVERLVEKWGIDNVELPGLVDSEDIPSYIDQMDICLNTFKRVPVAHSAVPLKLFEYLSMGRPVVSTSIREVQHIDSGYLYYADTPDALAGTIQNIVREYDNAVKHTLTAKESVANVYNWDVIATEFASNLEKYDVL